MRQNIPYNFPWLTYRVDGEEEKKMTENELKAKALVIGINLKKLNWFEWSGTKAHTYCVMQAKGMGIKDMYLDYVAYSAMHFVIN